MFKKNLEKLRHDYVDQKGKQKEVLLCFGNPGVPDNIRLLQIHSPSFSILLSEAPIWLPYGGPHMAPCLWLQDGFNQRGIWQEIQRRGNRERLPWGGSDSYPKVAHGSSQALLRMILSPYRLHNFPLPCPFGAKHGNCPASAISELI